MNEINFAREIRVQKTEDGREVSLNSEQRKAFFDAIKVSKKISVHKGFCPYRVYIDYSKANDISFMTNGNLLGKSGTSLSFQFENNCADLLESFFAPFDFFENNPENGVCLRVDSWAGIYYFLSEVADERYYVVEIVLGSGLPIISVSGYDVHAVDNCIKLDNNAKIILTDGGYEFYQDDRRYNCSVDEDMKNKGFDWAFRDMINFTKDAQNGRE